MQNEATLLSQLKSEDTKELAFKTLVELYKERLYWHIRKIVISHDDSDDVLQNTFIKIVRNIHNFKGDSKLFTWMYRIATNEAITFLNSKARRHQISDETLQDQVAFIRETVAKKYSEKLADEVSILYGGSVKPANAKEIFSKPDVDGGLIGGAALDVEQFLAIINAF